METNVPKRRDNKKSLRVKVISLGNAEVGKVRAVTPNSMLDSADFSSEAPSCNNPGFLDPDHCGFNKKNVCLND